MHLRKFYFLTLFLKLYLFFSIPPMPYPLHAKPSWVSSENLVIWSFGHFAVFYAWLLLVLSLIWWIENRSFDEKKNRAGGNEDCGFCLLCFIYYLLFIIYYLLFIICFLTLYLPIASSSAMASWSGQLVPFEPHSMPLRRAITSSAFWPLINELMPCRLPWQPPANVTLKMVLSSLSSMSIRRLHVPLVV